MSSFFSIPGEKKRKRAAAPDGPQKRVAAAGKAAGKASGKGKPGARQAQPLAPKKNAKTTTKSTAKKPARSRHDDDDDEADDDSLSGSDSDSLGSSGGGDDEEANSSAADDSDLEEAETAAERRLRLAERYLDNVRKDVETVDDRYAFDAEDVDRDLIAERLEEDVAEAKGRIYRQLADEMGFAAASHCTFRWNAQNVNAVAVCPPYAYTGSSDSYLTKWRLQDLPDEQQRQRDEKKQQYEEEKKKSKKSKKNKSKKDKSNKSQTEEETPAPARKRPERVLYRRGDPRRRQDKDYKGHVGAILSVAASQDGRFVATGGADRRLVVYDAATLQPLRVFTHHRDAVTGLVFRRGTNQLYSCSRDRTIKIWSLDELAYVQTLFGHQDEVVDIDALAQERCVSVGTRDRTARMWKVVEETQLVFRGGGSGEKDSKKKEGSSKKDAGSGSAAHEGSMDRVAMLDDELFVTGSDNGALALWSTQKKKPLSVIPRAHGIDPPLTGRETFDAALASPAAQKANPPPPPQPRWITALRTLPYADIVLSGSWDGCIRVWRLSSDKRRLEPLAVLGHDNDAGCHTQSGRLVNGVVNGIAAFERGERGRDGLSIIAAVGREHRLGRWGRTEGARNGAVVFEVPPLVLHGQANGQASSSSQESD